MTHEQTIDHLSGLIAVCKDGELGYQTAAANVRNTELTSMFEDYSKQRSGFVRELQAEVERLGGIPPDHGSITAALHRGWMDLKAALTGGGAGAIIAACETGEDSAEAAFEGVANLDLSGQSRALVEKQWHKIQEAHKRLLRLKAETASGADFPSNE